MASQTSAHRRLAEAKAHIEGFLNYTFEDVNNLEEALWSYGARLPNGRNLPEGNKSLAVVGDAVIYLVVKNDCYIADMLGGPANLRYQSLSKNLFLGNLRRAIEIAPFVEMNPGAPEMSVYMRATAVEAVLGAVFKDCKGNFETLKRAVKAFGVLED